MSEFDAGQSSVQVTLSGSGGAITLGSTANIVLSTGTGSGDTTVVFTGTLAQVNAALNGLAFRPMGQASQLSITVNDLGYGNPAAARSTTVTVQVSQVIQPTLTPTTSAGTSSDTPPATAGASSDPSAATPADAGATEGTTGQAATGSASQSTLSASAAQTAQSNPSAASNRVANVLASVSTTTLASVLPATSVSRAVGPLATADRFSASSGTGYDGQERTDQGVYSTVLLAAGLPDPLRLPAWAAVARQHHWVDAVATDWLQLASLSANKSHANDSVEGWAVGSALGLSTAFSVGYVLWCLRGGYLLATALSAVPVWRNFDPLPILDQMEQELPPPRKHDKPGQPAGSTPPAPAVDDEQELGEILLDR